MQDHRPLTDVENEYMDAIRSLGGRTGKFGIGDVAVAVGRTRSAASKVVNRLARFGEIKLSPHFDGCMRTITIPSKSSKQRRSKSAARSTK